MATQVLSIGYERRSLDEVVSLLQGHKISTLIDVRDLPLSRRKGFSKSALSSRMAEEGIEYVHLKAAGNPYRKLREDVARCLALYRGHLRENPTLVEEAGATLASARRVAVLCYERSQDHCHRGVLFDLLHEAGFPIEVVRVE